MAIPNISDLDLVELRKLLVDVEAQIAAKEEEAAEQIRERMAEEARAAGLSIDQVLKGAKRKKRAQPRFRNPENTKETWIGTGRKPKWLSEKLAAGKTLDDFRI